MKRKLVAIVIGVIAALACVSVFIACGDEHEHKYEVRAHVRTCETDGYAENICPCGDKFIDTRVKALGHSFGEFKDDKNAACTNGTETARCVREGCNATITREKVGTALGHNYVNNVCTRCGEFKLNYIAIKDDKGNVIGYSIAGMGTETAGNIIIPETYNSKPVTRIVSRAFKNYNRITSITIPNSVTSIESRAFEECSSLTSITIPFIGASKDGTGNTHFGYIFGASSSAENRSRVPSSLNTVVITGGTNIGYSAFYGCSSLTSITIPEGVTSIGDEAFYGCSSLTRITIPNSVTSIGSSAFSGCRNLEAVNWNATACTSAGSSIFPIFSSCSKLTTINIGDNVTTIPSYAFCECSSLTSITIPNSVTSIGSWAFSDCSSITRIDYTGNIASWCGISGLGDLVNSKVYINGEKLADMTSITIPTGVTSIGGYAFSGCSSLASVTISSSVTSISGGAFSGCSSLTRIDYTGNIASWCGISGLNNLDKSKVYINGEKLTEMTSITVSESVIIIKDYAFSGCSSLASVTISNSVTSIESRAFENCSSLTSITVDSNNSNYSSQDGILYNKAKTLIVHTPRAITGAVTIPNSVTSIESGAFSGCSSLTSITIPNSVTSINGGAFSGCDKLIQIENGVQYVDKWVIGYDKSVSSVSLRVNTVGIAFGVFSGCSSLTSITIPNSVTSIGNGAFSGCVNLTSITIPTGVTSIGSSAFENCHSLTNITIPNSVTSIGNGAFFGCTNLTSITIPNSVTSIGDSAFWNCSSLTSITIPSSVTSIGSSTFFGCSSLTSIIVDEKNTVYASQDGILYNKAKTRVVHVPKSLRGNVTIPSGVTSIGEGAFYNCSNLTSITIPNSVTDIERYAFSGCTGITSITIPNSVKNIGDFAFGNCTSITSITIPNSVTSIAENAFYGCSSLTSITFQGTKAQWNAYVGSNLSYLTGNYVIHCTDGDIVKS